MELTNIELFFFEKALTNATSDLRASKVKNLSLNVFVFRNLKLVSEICDAYRKEIDAFKPERLVELNAKSELTEEETAEKKALAEDNDKAITEFLNKKTTIEFHSGDIDLSAMNGLEVNYDSSTVIGFLLDLKNQSKNEKPD